MFPVGVERFLLVHPFRNRSTQTCTRTQQTSPRGSNISLFKTSLREEPWNTTHQQPRRVLQEALHVATSGKSWLGSREKIFYLEHPRGAARAGCARGIYRPYYYASARIASDILSARKILSRFNFETPHRIRAEIIPSYCLFHFFSCSRKIHTWIIARLTWLSRIPRDTVDEKCVAHCLYSVHWLDKQRKRLSEIIATLMGESRIRDYRSDTLAKVFKYQRTLEILASGSPHGTQFARAFSLRVSSLDTLYTADTPLETSRFPSALLFARVRTWVRIPAENRRRGARCIVTSSRRCS